MQGPSVEVYLVGLMQGLLPAGSYAGWGDLGEGVAPPFIVLSQISGMQDVDADGPLCEQEARIQIDVLAQTPDEARALGDAVLDLLNGHRGGPILTCFNQSDRDLSAGSGSLTIRRRSLDFAVSYYRI